MVQRCALARGSLARTGRSAASLVTYSHASSSSANRNFISAIFASSSNAHLHQPERKMTQRGLVEADIYEGLWCASPEIVTISHAIRRAKSIRRYPNAHGVTCYMALVTVRHKNETPNELTCDDCRCSLGDRVVKTRWSGCAVKTPAPLWPGRPQHGQELKQQAGGFQAQTRAGGKARLRQRDVDVKEEDGAVALVAALADAGTELRCPSALLDSGWVR